MIRARNLSKNYTVHKKAPGLWGSVRSLVARAEDCVVDRDERKGTQPSDHAPLVSTFTD